jgi:cbb3-type cytochrome oxidase maturation protein
MLVASVVILTVMLLLGLMTVGAFSWAASDRQFDNFEEGARVIFDEDEPVGEPTDPDLQNPSDS